MIFWWLVSKMYYRWSYDSKYLVCSGFILCGWINFQLFCLALLANQPGWVYCSLTLLFTCSQPWRGMFWWLPPASRASAKDANSFSCFLTQCLIKTYKKNVSCIWGVSAVSTELISVILGTVSGSLWSHNQTFTFAHVKVSRVGTQAFFHICLQYVSLLMVFCDGAVFLFLQCTHTHIHRYIYIYNMDFFKSIFQSLSEGRYQVLNARLLIGRPRWELLFEEIGRANKQWVGWDASDQPLSPSYEFVSSIKGPSD